MLLRILTDGEKAGSDTLISRHTWKILERCIRFGTRVVIAWHPASCVRTYAMNHGQGGLGLTGSEFQEFGAPTSHVV